MRGMGDWNGWLVVVDDEGCDGRENWNKIERGSGTPKSIKLGRSLF